MKKYRASLVRLESDTKQTLGALSIFLGTDKVFECKTIEPPWKNNEPFESCIPPGTYDVYKRYSDTYGEHWHIKNVVDRSLCLMHSGNFYFSTDGCVCVGRDYYDINQDGHLDVTSSKITMKALNNAISAIHFRLTIADLI